MIGLGYTLPAILAVLAVIALELVVLRTGLFRRPAYWISMVIVFAFQILVDGWLTKLSAPIVIYDDSHTSGVRFPFDIPIEDFLFGWAMVTAVLLLWERQPAARPPEGELVIRDATPGDVPAAFDAGAPAYDSLVRANPGYHAHLRLSAQRMHLPDGGRGLRLLDVGCGTGASTAALLAAAPQAEIIGVDGSAGMLAQAEAKSWPSSVRFVRSHVENLADAGVDGPFDGILAAYLIRNLADPDTQLRALRNLLRPGGTLAVHEYSVRDSRLATAIWNVVCTTVIIPAGRLRAGDGDLYRYLRRSVNEFDGASAFRDRLRAGGFTAVRSDTMPGWQRNVVHTFLAEAPR